MQVVTLLNEKGGVGKTSLSVHVAAGLAIRGRRVLLVDADAQGHSTFHLGLPESGGLYRLVAQDAEFKDVLVAPDKARWAGDYEAKGSLYVLPSNVETRAIPVVVSDVTMLRERLSELAGYVDVVVIDTSPTPSLLHSMIYLASDYMIYPSQCESLSLDGLKKSMVHMAQLKGTRAAFGLDNARLMGVQPTMFEMQTNAHRYALDLIRERFGEQLTWSPLAKRTIWRDTTWDRKTLFAVVPEHEATLEAWRLVGRVEKGLQHVA